MSYGFNSDKSKFPLGAASDLPDPTKTPLKIIGELQNQIIDSASIENGSTASKAYASGDYVCFQGALCKASKAISQGDTLSIGDSANDNLTLTDAAAEFARINSDLSGIFDIVLPVQINNTTAFDSKFHVLYDWTSWLNISGMGQYRVIIKLPAPDTRYHKLIVFDNAGGVFICKADATTSYISLVRTI